MSQIKLSASTFCAGALFASGEMDLEGFVRTISEIGYTGIELVSAQLVPGYPYPSDQWIEDTRKMLQKYNVELVAYGGYVDMVRYTGRDLEPEEILMNSRNDMVIAHRLGAKILKTTASIGVDTLRALRDDCDRWNIWIGLELHGPNGLDSDEWAPIVELIKEDGGCHYGIVPDACILQERPNEMFVRESLESGMTRERYDELENAFCAGETLEQVRRDMKLSPVEDKVAQGMYQGFSENMIDDMDLVFAYSRYAHGKYFYIDADDNDRGIDFGKMAATMKRQNFNGYISAEYEGYFHDINEDTVEQLKRYYRLMSRILAD